MKKSKQEQRNSAKLTRISNAQIQITIYLTDPTAKSRKKARTIEGLAVHLRKYLMISKPQMKTGASSSSSQKVN